MGRTRKKPKAVVFLTASTRCGISAKQLERELGVTYKTAWRMFNKIRNELMSDGDDWPGSRGRRDCMGREARARRCARAPQWRENQTTVLGMVERGGECALRVIICNLQQIELFTHKAIYGLDRVADADSSIY